MEEVNRVMSDAVEKHHSIRILGDLPTDQLDGEDYLASTRRIISHLITFWENKADLRLLAVEVWPQHCYFALDFNNDKYDYQTAHAQVIVIPVYLLRLSRRSGAWRIFRHSSGDTQLARRIADLHEGNGQNPIPFLEDHIKGVTHHAPRNCQQPINVP